MNTKEEIRQKLMNKAKRIRQMNEAIDKAAPEMFCLLESIVDAYNDGESQPYWDELVGLVSRIKLTGNT